MYLSDIKVWEPKENHTATVIFLHGYAEEAERWLISLSNVLPPYIKLICPQGPLMKEEPNKSSWYATNFKLFDHDGDITDIQKSSSVIVELIQQEINDKISEQRIVIGGFSQGGALAMNCILQSRKQYAGIFLLSSFIINEEEWKQLHTNAYKNTSLLMLHGTLDKLVPVYAGQYSFNHWRKYFRRPYFRTYPELMHSYNKQELEDVGTFLRQCLPPS